MHLCDAFCDGLRWCEAGCPGRRAVAATTSSAAAGAAHAGSRGSRAGPAFIPVHDPQLLGNGTSGPRTTGSPTHVAAPERRTGHGPCFTASATHSARCSILQHAHSAASGRCSDGRRCCIHFGRWSGCSRIACAGLCTCSWEWLTQHPASSFNAEQWGSCTTPCSSAAGCR